MSVDNQTAHLGLPLPDPANELDVDVLRLVESLETIDSAMQLTALELDEKADASDVAQAMAQKADTSNVMQALAGKAASGHTHSPTDIEQSGAVAGDVLAWDGSKYVPAASGVINDPTYWMGL